jgi:hypothetical protein
MNQVLPHPPITHTDGLGTRIIYQSGLMKIQVKVEEVLMLLVLFMEVEAIPMRMRMGLQVQEVATIRENLGLNCSLTVLGPDGLRLECLGVADE